MVGQTDIGMDGRWTGGMMDGQMDEYEGRWVDRQKWSWMLDGWMDGQMDGCGCGWVDKQL